jgi:hypothetical protein
MWGQRRSDGGLLSCRRSVFFSWKTYTVSFERSRDVSLPWIVLVLPCYCWLAFPYFLWEGPSRREWILVEHLAKEMNTYKQK